MSRIAGLSPYGQPGAIRMAPSTFRRSRTKAVTVRCSAGGHFAPAPAFGEEYARSFGFQPVARGRRPDGRSTHLISPGLKKAAP